MSINSGYCKEHSHKKTCDNLRCRYYCAQKFLPELPDHDHIGTGDLVNGVVMISGQMHIITNRVLESLNKLNENEINNIVFNKMIPENHNVADDSFISYYTHLMGFTKCMFKSNGNWIHEKFYNKSLNQILNERAI